MAEVVWGKNLYSTQRGQPSPSGGKNRKEQAKLSRMVSFLKVNESRLKFGMPRAQLGSVYMHSYLNSYFCEESKQYKWMLR